MSEIERLVKEIGFEVQMLSNQVEMEKNNMANLHQKMLSLVSETESQKRIRCQLEDEIENLENLYFRFEQNVNEMETLNSVVGEQIESLENALTEIAESSAKIRDERTKFISEYREKLENYNNFITKNEKLRAFVELWKNKRTENFQLTALPDIIREISRDLVQYYDKPLDETLDEVLSKNSLQSSYKSPEADRGDIFSDATRTVLKEIETDNFEDKTEKSCSLPALQPNHRAKNENQIKECNIMEASRLNVSMLDTSVLSSFIKKQDASNKPSLFKQPESASGSPMRIDNSVDIDGDNSSY